MVGPGRLELPTPRLSSVCSNQLSYGPIRVEHTHSVAAIQPPGVNQVANSASKKRQRGPYLVKKEKRRRRFAPYRQNRGSAAYVLRWSPDWCHLYSKKRRKASGNPWPIRVFLRKEVIQPQVPLRLPCYDFTPVADPTVVACPLAVSAAPSGKTNSHGVTGGVYKARERIHRSMLICDY